MAKSYALPITVILVKEKKSRLAVEQIIIYVYEYKCVLYEFLSFSSSAQNPVYLNEKVLFLNKRQIIFRILYILLFMLYISIQYFAEFFFSFSFKIHLVSIFILLWPFSFVIRVLFLSFSHRSFYFASESLHFAIFAFGQI